MYGWVLVLILQSHGGALATIPIRSEKQCLLQAEQINENTTATSLTAFCIET